MELNLKDIGSANAQALFADGDTVTIKLYNRLRQNVTPADPNDICTQIGTTGVFQWAYSNLVTIPESYEEFVWIMTNQTGEEQLDVDAFFEGEVPKTFFMTPFDVDVSKNGINKGDSFQPEIRIDTNSSDLNVAVEFSDMETTIYKATSDISDRGDELPGGDDQVLLVAQGDTFQIFRIYLSGAETESFESRFVDMKITAETQDGKIQTIKKKIPFSETLSISFDTVS